MMWLTWWQQQCAAHAYHLTVLPSKLHLHFSISCFTEHMDADFVLLCAAGLGCQVLLASPTSLMMWLTWWQQQRCRCIPNDLPSSHLHVSSSCFTEHVGAGFALLCAAGLRCRVLLASPISLMMWQTWWQQHTANEYHLAFFPLSCINVNRYFSLSCFTEQTYAGFALRCAAGPGCQVLLASPALLMMWQTW
jgi:hypothetical protein